MLNLPRAQPLALALLMLAPAATSHAQWELTWADEFDESAVDTVAWDVLTRRNSFNNELQYYLPQQASIAQTGGRSVLRITATNQPFDGKAYRSARLESNFTQAYGRFEVVGRIPTTKGIWPAIWLLPRSVDWPLGGEIDIMEHAGSNPQSVSSAYHWNNVPGTSQYLSSNHAAPAGQGAWASDFHQYAVEWDAEAIRYFIDGVNHYTITPDMAPISSTPMSVILNTAVGGDFDGNPSAATQFPNTFDIDHVRVFQRIGTPANLLSDGDFTQSTSAWTRTGNAYLESHNPGEGKHAFNGSGDQALKLFGFEETHASQTGIQAQAGGVYTLTANVRVDGNDSIAGTDNQTRMWLEFFSAAGQSLGSESKTIAAAATTNNTWLLHTLEGVAPTGTATVGVSFEFIQPGDDGGAVWIDRVALTAVVPEPGAAVVMGLAGGAALLRRRRVTAARTS